MLNNLAWKLRWVEAIIEDLVNQFLTNPSSFIPIIVELVVGIAFGYYFRKLVKGLIGLVIVSFIGMALNYSQFLALKDAITAELDISPEKFMRIVNLVTATIGLTVLAPLAIGILIGIFLIPERG